MRSLTKHFSELHSLINSMYLKKTLHYTIRDDLSVVSDEYETLWVEIKTGSKAKNILCCCAYRHPNTDIKSFVEYNG